MQPNVDDLFQRALDFQDAHNYPEAQRLHQEVLARSPSHARAVHCLGLIAMETGHLADAESLMRQSIALHPDEPDFYLNLAEALRRAGNLDAAVESLQRAIQIDPRQALAYAQIADILANAGRHEESIPWARKAIEIKPGMAPAFLTLGQSLIDLGQMEQAAEVYRLCLQHHPNNEPAKFFLAAATGQTTPTAPSAFVSRLFDQYADRFDDHLVKHLSYRVPELLHAAVERVHPTGQLDILDVGCGTGLVGARFQHRAKSMFGVDLSQGMLRVAAQRAIYQRLEHGDLLAILRRSTAQFDLVLAGDVSVYVGDLTEVFAATHAALRADGLFAFSVELHPGESFILCSNRRYAYSRAYIEPLAARSGFDIASAEQEQLRHEHQNPVEGIIYVLRRR